MKKTIIVAITAICLLATNFTANAQKGKKYYKAADVPVKADAVPVAISVGDLINKVPKQDKNLAQLKGTIKNEADSLFDLTDINTSPTLTNKESYTIYLNEVIYNWSNVPPGGLMPVEYGFVSPITNTWYKNVVVTKVSDREFNYTIYNVPLNTGAVVAFHFNDPTGAAGAGNGGRLCKMKVTGAFTDQQIYRGNNAINASPNYQATIAGQVLSLPTIIISNPLKVN